VDTRIEGVCFDVVHLEKAHGFLDALFQNVN